MEWLSIYGMTDTNNYNDWPWENTNEWDASRYLGIMKWHKFLVVMNKIVVKLVKGKLTFGWLDLHSTSFVAFGAHFAIFSTLVTALLLLTT
jgi:hypothetical protein